jgi:hypothetical protein
MQVSGKISMQLRVRDTNLFLVNICDGGQQAIRDAEWRETLTAAIGIVPAKVPVDHGVSTQCWTGQRQDIYWTCPTPFLC